MANATQNLQKANVVEAEQKDAATPPKPAAAEPKAPPKRKTAPKPAVAKTSAAGASKAAAPKSNNKSMKAPPATKPKSKPVAEPIEKVKKAKLVRDSFTMPEAEYRILAEAKKTLLKAGVAVKKSELLRAGVALIQKLDIANLKTVLESLAPLKAGRPKQEK